MTEATETPRKSRTLLLSAVFAVVVALAGLTIWYLTRPTDCCAAPEGETIAVPSGQPIYYVDTISNVPGMDGLTYRFRFIAPAINRETGTMNAESSVNDMLALCNTFALARLPNTGPLPNQIIISLSDRDVPFGEPAPQATQFFEGFTVKDGLCVWELF